MLSEEFSMLKYFTQGEVERSGAKIEDVKYKTMIALDDFRGLIDRKVFILKNGMTSGGHRSETHKNGEAVDNRIDGDPIHPKIVLYTALQVGFRGFGVYWNGMTYTYHFDLRPKFAFWGGRKSKPGSENEWVYCNSLIADPQVLLLF